MPKCLAVGYTLAAVAELGSGLTHTQILLLCSGSALGVSTVQENCLPVTAGVPGHDRLSLPVRGEGCSQLRAAQARQWLF